MIARSVTVEEINKIRELTRKGIDGRAIALLMRRSVSVVSLYARGDSREAVYGYGKGTGVPITPEQVAEINRRGDAGERPSHISREMKLSYGAVHYHFAKWLSARAIRARRH